MAVLDLDRNPGGMSMGWRRLSVTKGSQKSQTNKRRTSDSPVPLLLWLSTHGIYDVEFSQLLRLPTYTNHHVEILQIHTRTLHMMTDSMHNFFRKEPNSGCTCYSLFY